MAQALAAMAAWGGDGEGGTLNLCDGVTCDDTECKTNGVCDASDGMCDYTRWRTAPRAATVPSV